MCMSKRKELIFKACDTVELYVCWNSDLRKLNFWDDVKNFDSEIVWLLFQLNSIQVFIVTDKMTTWSIDQYTIKWRVIQKWKYVNNSSNSVSSRQRNLFYWHEMAQLNQLLLVASILEGMHAFTRYSFWWIKWLSLGNVLRTYYK